MLARFSRSVAAILAAALLAGPMAVPTFAQSIDASTLTPEELELLFLRQKTRGLVLAPAEPAAGTEAAATDPAAATTITPETTIAEGTTVAPEQYVANDAATEVNIQIAFDFDSAALREDQKPKLAPLCTVMQSNANWVFRIVGHTDASGSADYNYRLSMLRAEEVKRYMNSNCGIAESRLLAIGVGKDFLANPDDPRADENRRVEFQLLS